jgi:hypothetical protein
MTEKSPPDSKNIEAQHAAHVMAERKAADELDKAVMASKKFFEENDAAIIELGEAEKRRRDGNEEGVVTQEHQLSAEERRRIVQDSQRASAAKDIDRTAFDAKIDEEHTEKVNRVRGLHKSINDAHNDTFGPFNSDEFGTAAVDYMTQSEINSANKRLDEYEETVAPKIAEANADLKAYYDENQEAVQANAEILMTDDLRVREQRRAGKPAAQQYYYENEDEEQ